MYVLLFLILFILFLIYKYKYVPTNYWKKLDIPYEPFNFPFGIMRDSTFLKKHLGETLRDIYRKYENVPYVGIYRFNEPQLLIRDPELVNDILVADFTHFHNNGVQVQDNDILSKNPFAMDGEIWKAKRSFLIKCFTSAKLKLLVPSMEIIAERFVKYIEATAKLQGPLEAKDLCVRFTVENVMNTSYGIEANCFKPGISECMKMSHNIFKPSLGMHIRFICVMFLPALSKYLDLRFIPKCVQEYFTKLISDIIYYRKSTGLRRNDFLGILLDMQGKMAEECLTDIIGDAVALFGDGTETSGNTISQILYEIANNLDAQKKVIEEVDAVMTKYNGKLSYEAIQEMKYMDCVICESMRLHPAILMMQKSCTKDYTLPSPYKNEPNKTIILKAGTLVGISPYALHLDKKYFPEPERFKPERFSDENKDSIVKGTYLPFGDGPRICLGQRFALLQIKVALALVLSNFELRVNSKTKRPLKPDPKYFMVTYKDGLWLDFSKRK